MTDFIIREPRAHEAVELAELHLETCRETYAGRFPASAWGDEARANRLRLWEAICSQPRPTDRFAVAERRGRLIGFAGSGVPTENAPVRDRALFFLYLLAAEHGSGAGQAVLDHVLGEDPASLWVLEDNPRARAFYTRNGFAPDGARQPTGYESGGDEVRMVR
ncbi:GNAT family N-acetyltransferase [Mycetocola tolaasinivorans]|uniref:GNAT family N-acetyltransferase n=1 Tax=Mycetocola tolaasinivorans TaxID=76635 RepID=A0A3L7A8L1_9MICO|nr:GNAT family N-acetyltransferase [Mycetocola tolaasinivorans]RLP76394.1 GNAT family N-acetyltransferase [Mycetocola tolaasinivorans]